MAEAFVNRDVAGLSDAALDELLKMILAGERPLATLTPLERLTREFLESNWRNCLDGLLSKTRRIRVMPLGLPAPQAFEFEFDLPYKRRCADGRIELAAGPVRGRILYRPDLYAEPELPAIAVRLDPQQSFFHPNVSSKSPGSVCLGDLPGGPYPLDALLELHLYGILTYQNRRPSHPADLDAARYFAFDPSAMEGLEHVDPLY